MSLSGGIRAVWSGTVPPGASITHLGVPQPVIERHFIQAADDTILVKEVFLFRAPPHWATFQDSTFEIVTPTASARTAVNAGSGEAHRHHRNSRGSKSEERRHRRNNSEERRHNRRSNGRENHRSGSHDNNEEEDDDDDENNDDHKASSTSGSGSSFNGDRLNGSRKDLSTTGFNNGEMEEMEDTSPLKEDKMVDDIIITVNGQENEEF